MCICRGLNEKPTHPRLMYLNTWPQVDGNVLEGLCVSGGVSLVGEAGEGFEVSKAHTIAI